MLESPFLTRIFVSSEPQEQYLESLDFFPLSARSGQLGPYSKDRAAGTCELEQDIWDRAAGTGNARQVGPVTLDRTERTR
jgi:hypothetical protein